MVENPETPGISPDTSDLEHSGESSGYRPGNYGLGSPDTPGPTGHTRAVLVRSTLQG